MSEPVLSCSGCGKDKPDEDFHKDRRRPARRNRRQYCKECCRLISQKNARVDRDRRYRRKYDLSFKQVLELIAEQNGECGICKRELTPENKRVDHCHETGEVRGILCHKCNIALGTFGDDLDGINRVVRYLEEFDERLETE